MSDSLAQVKLALARKYQRLAQTAGSKLKREKFARRAERYRRQAEQISRK